MWNSKLFWKLFLIYPALGLVLALGFVRLTADRQQSLLIEQSSRYLSILAEKIADDEASSGNLTRAEALDDESNLDVAVISLDQAKDARPPADEALAGRRGVRVETIKDQRTVVRAAAPIRRDGKVVGAVVVSEELASSDRASRDSSPVMWLFPLSVVAVAAAVTFLIVRKPLGRLTAGAAALAEQPSGSRDEFSHLGAAFSQMRRDLAGRVHDLKAGNERLETILGGMVEGVLAIGPDETILIANQAGRRLLEMNAADPVGRPLLEVTRNLAVHNAVVAAFASSEPVEREFPAHGSVKRNLALRAMRLPGVPCPGVMVVLHDVTELRRLENLRRDFAANVSHELKTPLASIKAYAETLKLGAIHDPENRFLFIQRIEEQAERLHQLILDMLQIARVESGKEVFDITDVEVRTVVEECLEQFIDLAQSRGIDLTSAPSSERLLVRADEEGLHTILRNLIDNALKYTSSGGRVTVRWSIDGNFGLLAVEDTGIGIAERDQSRLFERFYRVDKARAREMGGTGLGLAIVKHLAQAFGGTVGVESKPGVGSTFLVRLPRERAAVAVSPAASSS